MSSEDLNERWFEGRAMDTEAKEQNSEDTWSKEKVFSRGGQSMSLTSHGSLWDSSAKKRDTSRRNCGRTFQALLNHLPMPRQLRDARVAVCRRYRP